MDSTHSSQVPPSGPPELGAPGLDPAAGEGRVALVTGGSLGLGRALTAELVRQGWRVVTDARQADRLTAAAEAMAGPGAVVAVPGDVADPAHRAALAAAVAAQTRSASPSGTDGAGLDLLVNNASVLGPSPQPQLAEYPLEALQQVYAVNTFAPLGLVQLLLAALDHHHGVVINVSSDAALEAYPGWGGYGSAKAALDQLTAILAAEHPTLRVYAFDPGDMATGLQQQAFPDEDITDRTPPEDVVPAVLRLVAGALPSGRYRAADLLARTAEPAGSGGPRP